jgi:hypothetical protein
MDAEGAVGKNSKDQVPTSKEAPNIQIHFNHGWTRMNTDGGTTKERRNKAKKLQIPMGSRNRTKPKAYRELVGTNDVGFSVLAHDI